MRLAILAALVASVGCSSALKREIAGGPPKGYLEALANDEGITVEEARQRLVESRSTPVTPSKLAASRAARQPASRQVGYGARMPSR